MNGVTAEIVEDTAALAALSSEWWDLWRRCPSAMPFQAPAWLIPWWRHFSPGALFTLVARQGGRLIGIAPGYIEASSLGRRILPLGISLSDHLDILVDPDCADQALVGLAAAAQSRAADWDSWELEDLAPGAAALRLPLPAGCADSVVDQASCPRLPVPEGANSLADFVPKRKRSNLKLAQNRCARRGAVQVTRAHGPEALAALELVVRLHGTRWRTRGEPGLLASPQVLAFHRDCVPLLEDAGLLRLYTLSLSGRAVAGHYGLTAGRRASVYLTGFDPDFEFESPGVVLLAHALGEAVAEGCREFDFLRGREAYKYEWGAVDCWNVKRSIRRVADV